MTDRDRVERYLKQHRTEYYFFCGGFLVYATESHQTRQEEYLHRAYSDVPIKYLFSVEEKILANYMRLYWAICGKDSTQAMLEEMIRYDR